MKKLVLLTLALTLSWTLGAGFGYLRGTSDTLRGTGHLITNTDGKNVIMTDNLAPKATAPFWVNGQKPSVANAIWRFTEEDRQNTAPDTTPAGGEARPEGRPATGTTTNPQSGK